MSNPAVLVAVRKRLSEIAGLPDIVWPNEAKTVTAPFLVFDNGIQNGTVLTVDGIEAFELRPQVSLMVEPNTFTSAGDLILFSIAQAFKVNTKITDDLGNVIGECRQTPFPDNGAPDGGYFRRNMILRITSYQKL